MAEIRNEDLRVGRRDRGKGKQVGDLQELRIIAQNSSPVCVLVPRSRHEQQRSTWPSVAGKEEGRRHPGAPPPREQMANMFALDVTWEALGGCPSFLEKWV